MKHTSYFLQAMSFVVLTCVSTAKLKAKENLDIIEEQRSSLIGTEIPSVKQKLMELENHFRENLKEMVKSNQQNTEASTRRIVHAIEHLNYSHHICRPHFYHSCPPCYFSTSVINFFKNEADQFYKYRIINCFWQGYEVFQKGILWFYHHIVE